MKQFIGTKIILAKSMTLGDYNKYQGWDIPADQDPNAPGFLVEYTDGGKPNHIKHANYISWSPEEQFKGAYENTSEAMTFGHALVGLKQGLKIARTGWNGAGQFVYFVNQGDYLAQSKAIKGVFKDDLVPYTAYLAIKTAQDQVSPWVPSMSDCVAEDWVIVA